MENSVLARITALQNCKVMVIGDMVADVYLEGKVARISREAPVLILEHTDERVVPGGAANVLNNLIDMGGEVYAVGIVGRDSAGEKLLHILNEKTINTAGIMADDKRPTITKTRVMAGGQATVRQQIVRIDREEKKPLPLELEQAIEAYVLSSIAKMNAVVLSDYTGFTISAQLIRKAIDACRARKIPCMVDSRYNVMAYQGITVVKQNESEAAAAVGLSSIDGNQLYEAGKKILEGLSAEAVIISRGPDGMTLFEKSGQVTTIPVTDKSEVYDVTGAGDTVVAVMALALASGASYVEAARLANFAAGVVVRKPGTATVNPEELYAAVSKNFKV
ncbi:MAG: PfkB family carbohydrate kinase [Pelosinus sp.]|nr:PfkB family carbohydrate kinase [Pelosinus sp.]